MLAIIIAAAFIFATCVLRVLFLSTISGPTLQIKAAEQWVRNLPLTAKRGAIVDCNNNVLASSKTSYDVYVRAKEVDSAAQVTEYLSRLLNLNFEKTYEKVKNIYTSESLIKLQIDENLAKQIVNKNFKGVYVSENICRVYPYNNSLCQVLGFLTTDSIGQTGLENYYNKFLAGTDGKYLTQSDVRGVTLNDSLSYYIDGIDGINLKLNIDITIQNFVEEIMKEVVAEHNPKGVSVVVMDPQTSKIIAMGITPNFDLNNVPRADAKALLSMVKNTMVTDVYEPGSTFKILTLAAALSENLTNINEKFYCPGFRIVDGQKIKCWKTTGHGSQTLVECVQNSCNCCFMDLALRLGKDKMYEYLKLFGIGNATGVDISSESSGILLDKNIVKNGDLARIGFGQSVAVTQLQLINSFCSIINGGNLIEPTLMNSFYDESGVLIENNQIIKNKTVSQDVSKSLRFLLEQSLSKTGEMTFVEGYKIAGKTGTAQKYGEDKKISQGKYVSSFFGFLNNNDLPQYAVLLCVDEPSSGAYYGSVVAKPYAKILFEKIIEYKNISAQDATVATRTYFVPNLVGKPLCEAILELEKLNIYYEIDGEGEVVKSQNLVPGSNVSVSTTLLLKT